MSKLIHAVTVILLVFCLVGCSKKTSEPEQKPTESESVVSSAETTSVPAAVDQQKPTLMSEQPSGQQPEPETAMPGTTPSVLSGTGQPTSQQAAPSTEKKPKGVLGLLRSAIAGAIVETAQKQ